MKKTILITLILLFAGLLSIEGLVAAEVKKTPLPVSSPTTGQTQKTGQPLPAIAESTYSYNPLGKADPFRPFLDEEIAAKKIAEKKSISSIFPLQREEIDKFRLVGIAGDNRRRVAVVEDAAKKYYTLFVGTHIGINNGKVAEILPDRIVVEEYKAKKAKRIILKLHKN